MSIPTRQTLFNLLACIVLLFTLAACATATPTPAPIPAAPNVTGVPPYSIIGIWRGEYDGAEVIMNFEANGNISYTVYGGLQGGTYVINYETAPFQMDLVIENPNDPEAPNIILTIFEFIDENTIRMENVYPAEPRPTAFNDPFILTR
jgi:hypothetical protein